MALQPILDFFALLIGDAAPTAKVWSYERIAVEPEQAEAVYGVTDTTFSKGWRLQVWIVDRTRTPERWETNQENVRVHGLRIQGYREVHDANASREDFRDETEAIAAILRNVPFDGPSLTTVGIPALLQSQLPEMELLGPPQIDQDGLSVIGETYLCHSVQILIDVQERVLRVPIVT